MAEGGPLEPLVVATTLGEERHRRPTVEDGWNEEGGDAASRTRPEDRSRARQRTQNPEENQTGPFTDEDLQAGDDEHASGDGCESQGEGETRETLRIRQKSEEPRGGRDDERVTQSDPEGVRRRLNSSEQQRPEGAESPEPDPTKAHRLTPDFPEALYELLFALQEGRRLNDQRCSFRLGNGVGRRRCHSEPNTGKPAHRVIFSSMTSLQREEFFELVATAQGRRLDDQRAQLERFSAAKPKARGFRGSLRQLSLAKRPAPAPKEDLYNMILTTQAQGRLEDQRSRAPGPVDDEDFYSLLLRVQGGRMDEQRTELPCMVQT